MATTTDDRLDLQAAADELGVHYQTAYRWVRAGRLPAQRVAGRYVVLRRDLDRLDRDRFRPEPPTAPSPSRMARSVGRMYQFLLDGAEFEAHRLARRLVDDGASVADVVQHTLAPALVRLGEAWHDGALPIWVEHRATAIVERILGDLTPNPRGRRRGTAVVSAVAGDRHSLPTSMATAALREDQWRVHHLGADVPGDDVLAFCDGHEVDLVVLTSTHSRARGDAHDLADRLRKRGVPALVGEPGRTLTDLVQAARSAVSSSPEEAR